MHGLRLLSILAAIAFLAPMAGAINVDPKDLPITGPSDATNTIPVGPETLYVYQSGQNIELWRETNTCAGLQRQAGFEGTKWCLADTKLADTVP